jgi:signal peptidase I
MALPPKLKAANDQFFGMGNNMMPSDDAAVDDAGIRSKDEAEIRNRAIKRAWLCPGAGFALVGARTYAIATFVASLGILPALAWIAFRPSAVSLWTTIAVLAIATSLWAAELISIKKAALHAPSPSILDRQFVALTCTMWFAAILAASLFFSAFGSLRMGGSGMRPTLEKAERLIYHKHVDWQSVIPGAIVVYKNADDSAWGRSGWLVVSRILAGPGDNISIQNENYIVNGAAGPPVADTGDYGVVLDIPLSLKSLTIPNDCYFIVQDSPSGGFDSRVLSWVRADKIVGSRLWRFSDRGIFQPVR